MRKKSSRSAEQSVTLPTGMQHVVGMHAGSAFKPARRGVSMGEIDPTQQPQPGMAPTGGVRYGGLGKRFLARIIDGLIVGIPTAIVLTLLPGVRVGGVVYGILSAAAGLGYFVFLETSQGATLGKKLLSMTVADVGGGAPISVDASLRRNWWLALNALSGVPVLGWLLSLVALGVVIAIAVTINSDPRKQGLHDKMGNTVVLDT
jgi:uncharacterized RDD family membrane protein YckC